MKETKANVPVQHGNHEPSQKTAAKQTSQCKITRASKRKRDSSSSENLSHTKISTVAVVHSSKKPECKRCRMSSYSIEVVKKISSNRKRSSSEHSQAMTTEKKPQKSPNLKLRRPSPLKCKKKSSFIDSSIAVKISEEIKQKARPSLMNDPNKQKISPKKAIAIDEQNKHKIGPKKGLKFTTKKLVVKEIASPTAIGWLGKNVRPASRIKGREISAQKALKKLIIDERDAAILRLFLQKHFSQEDLLKFDKDDQQKKILFYRINPLVEIERCPQIARMIQAEYKTRKRVTKELNCESEAIPIQPASEYVKKKPRPRGRPVSEYLDLEDHAIVSWVSVGGRPNQVNGSRLWRQLQEQFARIRKRQGRSWHSLRNRYLRYILPRLGSLALSPEQQARLRAAAATGETRGRKKKPQVDCIIQLPPREASPQCPGAVADRAATPSDTGPLEIGNTDKDESPPPERRAPPRRCSDATRTHRAQRNSSERSHESSEIRSRTPLQKRSEHKSRDKSGTPEARPNRLLRSDKSKKVISPKRVTWSDSY